MNLDLSQVLIQIIAFLLMLWILKKFGWKPLLNTLEQRRQKIQFEFDSIASQEEQVKVLVKEYQEKLKEIETEARHKIQEAVMEGRKIAKEIQEESQAQAKAILAKAKTEADREIIQARNQLKNDMVNMALAASEKMLRDTLDEPKHKKLIADFVEKAEFK